MKLDCKDMKKKRHIRGCVCTKGDEMVLYEITTYEDLIYLTKRKRDNYGSQYLCHTMNYACTLLSKEVEHLRAEGWSLTMLRDLD